jgi:hypothetical protein
MLLCSAVLVPSAVGYQGEFIKAKRHFFPNKLALTWYGLPEHPKGLPIGTALVGLIVPTRGYWFLPRLYFALFLVEKMAYFGPNKGSAAIKYTPGFLIHGIIEN